ncbi:CPBP family intramembrane glutamic endopeptidase [Amnibacterium endophyticum]|uniref:CPBP family intramembrane glutamic endopeptidase n=1 Tax=Amnibacterium endophyticum TaxID=2109337 RepID=A0ABW4LFN9_9MICO
MTEPSPASGPMTSPLPWRRSLVLLAVLLLVSALLVGALGLAVRGGADPIALIAWLAPGHALVMLGAIALLLRRWHVGFADLGFRPPTARLIHLLWQVPLMVVVVVAVAAVSASVIGTAEQTQGVDLVLRDGATSLVPVLAVGVVVLVPVWEEAVFRGVIGGGLARRFPVWVAVVGSSVLFAGAHAVPLLLPYLFTAGLCLALIARFHRTLWASVVAHGSLNALVLLVTLQAVTGR